ncbi:MAG: amidohydrolase [Saprospiraceae bacterium]|jgi:aminobenzoyl-glutamate utilization protein B|nr:amidohydrolase [Saprospiraceae bacterium]
MGTSFKCRIIIAFLFSLPLCQMNAQFSSDKTYILQQLDKKYDNYCNIAKQIWDFAELGYLENRSSALLQRTLEKEGFNVEAGVAEMPTSFVATYGSGKPVIGILAEFDALPGLSQDTTPYKKPLVEGGTGHGCGHNLFGTASMAAGIALKDWLIKNKRSGTVKVYGTPAEEGGGGKVYMVRAGLFKDVDAVIHWHPGDGNHASPQTCLAATSLTFKFYGKTAHSAAAPQRGRSALDGVEALNYMVNLMREHVDEKSRIHYIISNGGLASNVVPDFASAEYTVRHPDVKEVQSMLDRVIKAAQGAAMGTGTTVEYEIINGLYGLLPNETLAKAMNDNLEKLGGVKYNAQETAWATKLRESFNGPNVPPLSKASEIQPYKMGYFPASTDVGDVSYVVPTVGLGTATWVPGTAAHTWQAVAADGMSIGFKGMMLAAQTLGTMGVDLFSNPELVSKAKEEFKTKLGDLDYKPLIGDRKPPLDFRKGLSKPEVMP